MTILNNVEHGDLRYTIAYGPEFGDCSNRMQLCVSEFAAAQRHHPIIFANDSEDRLTPMALLGFERGENLHYNGSDWGDAYVPAARRRGPFSLTVKTDTTGQPVDMLVEVDLEDSRISQNEGIPLFKKHGGNAPMLDIISDALVTLYDGINGTQAFIDALLSCQLLREVQMDIDLGDGRNFSIPGHLVIDELRFVELDGATLQSLNKAGYLQPVVHALSSLANIQHLVDRKVAKANHAD